MKHTPIRSYQEVTNWLRSCSKEDKLLYESACKYEFRYFRDMTLTDKRIITRLGTICYDDGAIEEQDIQGELRPNILFWKFHFKELNDCDGQCDAESRTILVHREAQGEMLDCILLHEMIHAYENELWPSNRDWLLLWLYQRFARQFGDALLKRLTDTNLWTPVREPAHSLLFLFKSFDLDLRLDKPLGFVFAYGREALFANIARKIVRRRRLLEPKKGANSRK